MKEIQRNERGSDSIYTISEMKLGASTSIDSIFRSFN